MATFEYRAINPAGQMIAGAMEASAAADVLAQLDRAGFTPVSAREAGARGARTWRDALTPDPKPEDVTGFTLDLAMLLKGGVALHQALLILTEMETRRWLVRLARTLHGEISAGKSFSDALAAHPRLFPPVYVQTVAVAESAGRLEEALSDIARERARNEDLKRKFTSAIAYPAFLFVTACGVMSFVLLYVVPQFEGALHGFRSKLKPSTLFVFDLSRAFRENLDLIVIAIAAALVALLLAKRLGHGAPVMRLLARLPLTRTLMTFETTVAFCRTLSILLKNGVPITNALRLVRGVMRLPRAADAVDAASAEVRQGRRLSDALAKAGFLSPHVVQMLRVGEESGELAESAARVAGFYEGKLQAALKRVTAVVGPAMMILVAGLVAWLIISVMSALTSINDLLV